MTRGNEEASKDSSSYFESELRGKLAGIKDPMNVFILPVLTCPEIHCTLSEIKSRWSLRDLCDFIHFAEAVQMKQAEDQKKQERQMQGMKNKTR